ncbi:TIGR01620 family protein [Planktotalea sp.]|uniref:YcjF family protein n=1 Tax=Planktotalea sp. TaxID=2029877 RepID=UPI0025E93D1C|nr:TIGR01620 family protein [Planktotalea sp.]
MVKGPVLIDLEDAPILEEGPEAAQPVPDLDAPAPTGQAMQTVATLAARRPSRLTKWFWGLLLSLMGFAISLAAWDFTMGLIARVPILGYALTGLMVAFILVLLVMALRELAAFSRLKRMDVLHRAGEAARASGDLAEAKIVVDQITRLYKGREDTRWGRDALADKSADILDGDGLLDLAERDVLGPLDTAATREIEAAARQVAMVTALVPLALADVATALTSNLRMIRRIAEIYGGRSGALGNWRLTRAVMTHLVATGAVAIGDDFLSSIAGGGVLGKVSRRFGEGVVNGALTARVGVAAMEVCRPLPFNALKRPSVTGLVSRALTGLFGK